MYTHGYLTHFQRFISSRAFFLEGVAENGVSEKFIVDVTIKVALDVRTKGFNKQIVKPEISDGMKKGSEVYNEIQKHVVEKVLTDDNNFKTQSNGQNRDR